MKKILIFFFLIVGALHSLSQNTVWNQPAYSGNMAGVRFLVGTGPASTRYVTYETLTANLVTVTTLSSYYTKTQSDARYLQSFTETDPVWTAASASYYTKVQADARYLQSFTESDPIWTAASINYFTKSASDARYLQSFTESDPIWTAASVNYYTKTASDARYLQSFTESDPVWSAAAANYFTKTQSDARYLQSFTETDPTVPTNVKSISATNISNWNTAFSWGNHATAGYLTSVSTANLDNVFSSSGILVRTGAATYTTITNNSANWNTAYNKFPASAAFSGTTTKTLTITLNDATTITATFTDLTGSGGSTLAALTDVNITSVQDLQLLRYDAATSKWLNWTSNFLTANQSISFAPAAGGDVTGSASGPTSLTPTLVIGANKVTLSMMAQVATATFLGRTTAATGNVEAMTVAQAKALLNLTGTNSGDQTITLTSDVNGSGNGSFSTTVVGLRGVALPALGATAGFLKYTGTGTNTWIFDNSVYLTANQSITWTASTDISGSASGATNISPSLTVVGIRGASVPALAAGFLKYTGTVWTYDNSTYLTGLSVASSNGFAGSATSTATPAITITTSITGLLKGNGTAISSATSGTDYSAGTSGLATGILKSTTTTGALSIAVAADFPTLNQNTTGTASNITGVLNAASFPALTGDVTNTAGSLATTIGNGIVTLSKMASLAANSIIGNNTASPATPIALTVAQVKTLLVLNNVENTALSTWAGSTSITTLGNIATGTWSATAIIETKGGTNQTSYTLGDLLYASAANTLSKLAGNTTAVKQYLSMTGTGTLAASPAWATIAEADITNLVSDLSGKQATLVSGTNIKTVNGTTLLGSGNLAVGDMLLGTVQTVTAAKTFNAGTLILAAGTTALAPLVMTSGTNLTTAVAGSFEYDGTTLYFTPASTNRGISEAHQFVSIASGTVALSSATGVQSVFAAANDAVSLQATTTYRFRAVYFISNGTTTTHITQTAFAYSGTMTSILYTAFCQATTANTAVTANITPVTQLAATGVNATSAVAGVIIQIEGTCRTSTAGTFTPQIAFSAAPGGTNTVNAPSFFEIWPVGTATMTSVGTWQ